MKECAVEKRLIGFINDQRVLFEKRIEKIGANRALLGKKSRRRKMEERGRWASSRTEIPLGSSL